MTRSLRPLLALSVLAGLAACGSSNNGNGTPTPPVITPVTKTEDQFGACFATRFRADANTKATDPVPCPDLPPLSLTTKPVAL